MFAIRFTDSAIEDLRYLEKREQVAVLDVIREQLAHEPLTETRNRKTLRPNDLSTWELHVTRCRVFCDVDAQEKTVTVKTVGWKEHNALFIRGQELDYENDRPHGRVTQSAGVAAVGKPSQHCDLAHPAP